MTFAVRLHRLWPLLVACSTVAGCGRHGAEAGSGADRAARAQVFLTTEGGEPDSLDPHLALGDPAGHVISALLEGLVVEAPADGTAVVPGVAERWEVSPDGLTWTFHLRPDARWSNGDPVTADDFVFSYRRVLTPALGSKSAYYLFCLRGAQAYAEGRTDDFSTVGVKATDARTLRLELVAPAPYLLGELPFRAWAPVHPETVRRGGGIADRSGRWTRPETYVGNGPFTLRTRRPNDVIVLERNRRYWDAARVGLAGIRFYAIDDLTTAERAFLAGQLHKTAALSLDKLLLFRRREPERFRSDPFLSIYFFKLNVHHPALRDVRVRRALSLAVDREALVEDVMQGGEAAATGFTPPGLVGYRPLDVVRYAPGRARALLAEAGYPHGQGFPNVELLTATGEINARVAEAVQGMWRQELGVQIKIRREEFRVYLDSVVHSRFDACRSAWSADYVDPEAFLGIWTTGNQDNATGWGDPRFDEGLRAAATIAAPAERVRRFQQAEALLLDACPMIPLYWGTRSYLLDPRLQNWGARPLDNHAWKFLRFRD